MKKKTDYQLEVLLRIKQLRLNAQLSQPKLADLLDVTNGQIGNIESANQPQKYTLAQIVRLCEEFGCTINSIFTGKNTCTQDELIAAIVRYEEGEK